MRKIGVNVDLKADFSVVRETLTRCGIVSKEKKVITPTCYLYHENNEYCVCHFKELLAAFDEIPDKLSDKDTNRRNAICTLLENWGLVQINDSGVYQDVLKENIVTLTHSEMKDFIINHKFQSFKKLVEFREE